MDAFGIGNALRGQARCYFQTARRSGRTTALLESLRDGDRVIFATKKEADRVKRLAKQMDKEIEILVAPPKAPHDKLFSVGTPKGRTIFDHSWVEQFYLDSLDDSARWLDNMQRELSGPGAAHAETRLKAKEAHRWQPYYID